MLHSIDGQGRIVSVSHYWLEKLGYQPQEVIGKPISTFLTKASNGKMAEVRSRMRPKSNLSRLALSAHQKEWQVS